MKILLQLKLSFDMDFVSFFFEIDEKKFKDKFPKFKKKKFDFFNVKNIFKTLTGQKYTYHLRFLFSVFNFFKIKKDLTRIYQEEKTRLE